jgi:hypothetical protein
MKNFSEWMEQRELRSVPIRSIGRKITSYKTARWNSTPSGSEPDPGVMKRLCAKRGLRGPLRDKCEKLGRLPKKGGIDFGSSTDFTGDILGDKPKRTVMGHEVADSKPADWDSERWDKFNSQVDRWKSR